MCWGFLPYIIVPKVWRFMDTARFVCFIRLLLNLAEDPGGLYDFLALPVHDGSF